MREVVQLYRMVGGQTEGGAVQALALALDPPMHVWHALSLYEQTVNAVRAEDRRLRAEAAEKARQARGGR